MVKKLFKHEFFAWLRVIPILYGIMLAVAAINRCIQLFENDSIYYEIISASAIIMYAVVLVVGIIAPVVFGVTRFYRNLFTGEGYLSFTLPVTPANHLWAKVLTAVCFSVLSVIVCVLSVMIITAGEAFAEICKAAAYLMNQIPRDMAGHVAFYCVEVVVLLLLSAFGMYLMYYTYICIGQLFRKNRVLAAVGVYFGFYLISQILGTVMSVLFVILEANGALTELYTVIALHPVETAHIILCGSIVLDAVLALVCYLVCHLIIRRKLNLE